VKRAKSGLLSAVSGVAEALKTPVILCWLISALLGASCLADPCSNRGLRVPIVIRLSRWSAKNFYIAALLSRRQNAVTPLQKVIYLL
jgi:hypothetical protein